MAARLPVPIDPDAQGIQFLYYRIVGVNNLDTVDLAADFSTIRFVVASFITAGKTTFFVPLSVSGTVVTFRSAALSADVVVLQAGGRVKP